MSDGGLFLDKYTRFFKRRHDANGPEFHNPPPVSIPPPTVTFLETVRWWSWDRWRRRQRIRQERDRRVHEIVQMKHASRKDALTARIGLS